MGETPLVQSTNLHFLLQQHRSGAPRPLFSRINLVRSAICLLLLATAVCAQTSADIDTTPDSLRSYATLHAVGFEWDITGDANHDAVCSVRYRVAGTRDWYDAMGLLRVDFQGFFASHTADRHYNMLAGSILFLQPGTTYEFELRLSDPDGGGYERTETIDTRPVPALPKSRAVYVHPGPASGDGSLSAPLSLQTAVASATPGRVHCLLPGIYGQTRLDHAGSASDHIVWLGPDAARRAGFAVPLNGHANFERVEVSAPFQWIEGLHFDWNQAWPDSVIRGGLKATSSAATDIIVAGNRFDGYAYSIWLDPDADRWIISDNTNVGRKDIELEGSIAYSGEGIELQHSSGHTVAHNTISQVADGISYATRNCDIFGNDIFDTSDDGIEPDYGYANIRMWQNRIANTHYHAFSFQGMSVGPWYFIRNQVTTARGAIYKFRVTDRIVVVNNSFVAPTLGRDALHHLLHGIVRNNLYIRDGEVHSEPWRAALKYRGESIEKRYFNPDLSVPDWRTDWDYNGYDLAMWDSLSASMQPGRFVWFDGSFDHIADLAGATGIEAHGLQLDRHQVFVDYQRPTHPARRPGPFLQLNPASSAVDGGVALPNLADIFAGNAPDLGAHELGDPVPQYGARPPAQRTW